MKTRDLLGAAAAIFCAACAAACVGTIVDHHDPALGDDDTMPGTPDSAVPMGTPDANLPIIDGAIIPPTPDATPEQTHDVQPRLIAGGGVADAPIGGELNVHVIDARTGAPLSGASVRVGDAAASTPLTGTTDGSGLAVLTSGGLAGKQTVTASASGHAAATWIGVGGANVTVALAPTAAPPTATVTGNINGWDSLPAPPSFNDYNLAIVLYTFLDDLNAAENSIPQPTANGTPTNTCLRTAISNSCAWKMTARVGQQLHYAVIVRGNTRGTTNNQADDTYTLLGYAVGAATTLTPGQNLSNETLTMISAGAMTGLQVSFASAPSGLSDVVAIPMIDLGARGRVMLPLPSVTPASTSLNIPGGGAFAGGTTEVVSMATPPGAPSTPFSLAFARDVGGTSASPGAFPAPPAGLSAGGGSYAFSPMAGASLHVATLTATGGATLYWSVVILDGTTSFNLPTLAQDPLPSGSLELHVTGTQVGSFAATDFAMPTVTANFTRAGGDSVTFAH